MGTQKLTWIGDLQFEGVDSWGHAVAIGAPREGPGAKPADLLPLSLAACTAYDVVNVLRKQRQDLRGVVAHIESEQDEALPWAFRRISVRFVVTGDVAPAKAQRALALAEKSCSVLATIRDVVDIRASIEVEAPGVA